MASGSSTKFSGESPPKVEIGVEISTQFGGTSTIDTAEIEIGMIGYNRNG